MWDLPFLSNIWTPAPWRNVMPWQVVTINVVNASRYNILQKEEPTNLIEKEGVRESFVEASRHFVLQPQRHFNPTEKLKVASSFLLSKTLLVLSTGDFNSTTDRNVP